MSFGGNDPFVAQGPGGLLLPKPKPVVTTPVTGFQPGHGFFLSGGTSMNTDVVNFLNGSQSVSHTTDGSGGSNNYLKKNNIAPVIDLTGKMLRVWVKLLNPADLAHLSAVQVLFGSDNNVANYWASNTILSGVIPDFYGNENDWLGMTISFGEMAAVTGAPARNAVNCIWLRTQDNGVPVTVSYGGIEVVPEPPNGVISFTFDDSRLTQYQQARAKLSQYRYPATAYIIRDIVDNPNFVPLTMTTAMLRELQDYHGWEIAAHADTVAAHNLPNSFNDLTANQIEAELLGIRTWLMQNGFRGGRTMALPKGRHNQTVYDACRKYFHSTRTTFSKADGTGLLKHETYPPIDPNKLVVFYVYGTTPIGNLTAAVTNAIANKEWLIFVMHDIVAVPNTGLRNDTEFSIANFGTLVDFVNTSGGVVRTIGDVIEHGV